MARQDQVIEHLLEQGLVQSDALDALRAGHPEEAATALPVDGVVEESALLQALAVCYNCPPAGYRQGLFVERDVLDAINPELVHEYEVLPVRRREGKEVDVIVVEPLNEMARGILEEALDAPICQYIWPRIRFLQARHFFLGSELSEWIRPYLRAHPVTMGFASQAGAVDVRRALRNSETLGVRYWAEEDLHRFLSACFDRDTLLKVLLGRAELWLTNRLIVVQSKAGLQPYFVEEWPEVTKRFDDVELLRGVLARGSSLSSLDTEGWNAGSVEELGLAELFEALQVDAPAQLVAAPIQIGGRVAMAVVGAPTDRNAALRLNELSEPDTFEALHQVAELVGKQLEEMIKQAKQNTLPAPADRIPLLPEVTQTVGLGMEESLVEKTIAQRRGQRHRWEIIDISHIIETSEAGESSSPAHEIDDEQNSLAADPGATSFGMPAYEPDFQRSFEADPSATSFGMPALQESSSEGSSSGEAVESAEEEVASPFSIEVDSELIADPKSEATALNSEIESNADAGWDTVLSDVAVSSLPKLEEEEEEEEEPEAVEEEPEAVEEEPEAEEEEPEAEAEEEEPEAEEEEPEAEEEEEEEEEAPEAAEEEVVVEEPEEEAPPQASARGLRGMDIPTDASGVPMAQIFRRPKSVRAKTEQEQPISPPGEGIGDEPSIVGRTYTGVGEMAPLTALGGASTALAEPSQASHTTQKEELSWLDEIEAGASERPEGTLELSSETARTQALNKLLKEEAQSTVEHSPMTIPVEALEEVPPSGPVAVDIEESLTMIDSRDKETCFAAAEHLATAGARAIEGLMPLFPGRVFVDRYQYTTESMPPVSQHGPVLEALVRIGQPSLEVVKAYIADASLERRFYATYLLTELPAQGLFDELVERLFDRDQQTRNLAQNIIFAHRHIEGFDDKVLAPLRAILEETREDFRVEIAAENLRRFKDLPSVPLLIDALGDHPKRVLDTLHRALREITFQSLAPAPADWRRWWEKEGDLPRWRWLIDAMDNSDDEIRMLAFNEIEQLPGLDLNYHPAQPSKLRIRAQGELTKFFESRQ